MATTKLYRLISPHVGRFPADLPPGQTRVQADIDPVVKRLIHDNVLAGVRNVQSAIIATIYEKLAEELRRRRITSYDPANESLVAELLSRLNFRRNHPARRPNGGGRAGHPAPQHEEQPPRGDDGGSGVAGTGESAESRNDVAS